MFAYGLSSPPRFSQDDSIRLGASTATTPWPAQLSGAPWKYIMVSTQHTAGASYFATGGASTNAALLPQIALSAGGGPVILNASGTTHYDLFTTAGANDFCITPIDSPRGDGNMLRSPPQLTDAISSVDVNALGSALIPQLSVGTEKYVMITSDSTVPTLIAVGKAGITSALNGQAWINRDSGPLVLNVTGMDTIAWSATAGAFLQLCALAY